MPDIFISEKLKKKEGKKDKEASSDESGSKAKHSIRTPFKHRESKKQNPLMAFSYMPKNVDFEIREPEEKVVLLLRRHPVTNIKWMAIATLMLFAPAVLGSFPILNFMPSNFRFIAVLGWYLITSAFILENFLSWFFNVNIITDERIIDIDFVNLIYKEVSDANIDMIQDVTYKMGGPLRTFLNYGDVLIQTAAETPNFEFLAVPKPEKVAGVLQELRVEEEVEKLEGRVR